MVYVFDIDGTICTQVNRDYAQAIPIKPRIKAINKLYKEGHYIVFHTARGMGRSNISSTFAYAKFFELTQNQLHTWGVKYHSLYLGKPAGDVYIDDKGITDNDFFSALD